MNPIINVKESMSDLMSKLLSASLPTPMAVIAQKHREHGRMIRQFNRQAVALPTIHDLYLPHSNSGIDPEMPPFSVVSTLRPGSKTWEDVDDVFYALEDLGVIARHESGGDNDEGTTWILDEYDRDGQPEGVNGYCFYHDQDVERENIEDFQNFLYLTYGHIEPDAPGFLNLEIGSVVAREFKAAGFEVFWARDVRTRILLTNIDFKGWKRRFAEECLNYMENETE